MAAVIPTLAQARRLVVKVGSALLVDDVEQGVPDEPGQQGIGHHIAHEHLARREHVDALIGRGEQL